MSETDSIYSPDPLTLALDPLVGAEVQGMRELINSSSDSIVGPAAGKRSVGEYEPRGIHSLFMFKRRFSAKEVRLQVQRF